MRTDRVRHVGFLLALWCGSALGAEPVTESSVVTVPGRGWRIGLQTPPLMQFGGQIQKEKFSYRAIGAGGFNVSVFVEPPEVERPGHEAVFEHYWPMAKRNPMIDQASVEVAKTARFVRVSYLIAPPGSANGKKNRHVNYYFAHEGRWMDVHASQSPALADEAKLFEAFDAGLTYGPNPATPPAR